MLTGLYKIPTCREIRIFAWYRNTQAWEGPREESRGCREHLSGSLQHSTKHERGKNTNHIIATFQFSARTRTCIHFPRLPNPFVLLNCDLTPATPLLKTLQRLTRLEIKPKLLAEVTQNVLISPVHLFPHWVPHSAQMEMLALRIVSFASEFGSFYFLTYNTLSIPSCIS